MFISLVSAHKLASPFWQTLLAEEKLLRVRNCLAQRKVQNDNLEACLQDHFKIRVALQCRVAVVSKAPVVKAANSATTRSLSLSPILVRVDAACGTAMATVADFLKRDGSVRQAASFIDVKSRRHYLESGKWSQPQYMISTKLQIGT